MYKKKIRERLSNNYYEAKRPHKWTVMRVNKVDVKCVVVELKPNSLSRVREWVSYLKDHEAEALQSLENEGVTVENFFLFAMEGKDYLIGYMRAKSMDVASKAVKESLLEIDAYHQQFKKDTWSEIFKTDLVVNLSRIPSESTIA